MKKLAIFVEGYTEILFIEKLIHVLAAKAKVRLEVRAIRGGGQSGAPRTYGLIRASQPDTGQQFFVLLVDCGGDQLVKSRILEEHANLTKSGYSKIIGLRDVRPDFTYADIPKLEKMLPLFIKTSLIPVEILLAIMEVEAWFLAETTHFVRLDASLTLAAISAALGYDPTAVDIEQQPTPTADLQMCYALANKNYTKGSAQTTIDALDFDVVYFHLRTKLRYLHRLLENLEQFLTS